MGKGKKPLGTHLTEPDDVFSCGSSSNANVSSDADDNDDGLSYASDRRSDTSSVADLYAGLWNERNQVHHELDQDVVSLARRRLLNAIDAEHAFDARAQADRLSQGREALQNIGRMVPNLRLVAQLKEEDAQQIFKAYIDGAQALPQHQFKPGMNVAVLLDLEAPDTDDRNGAIDDIGQSEDGALVKGGDMPPADAESHDNEVAVADQLGRLELKKSFEATVRMSDDAKRYLTIATRYDDAVANVEDAPDARWVIMESMNDITSRRQRAAALALGTLISRSSRSQEAPSADEVRVRAVLLSGHGKNKAFSPAQDAAMRVSWMTDPAVTEVLRVLDLDSTLNQEQRQCLANATKRTVTLLKGPPGTGKSRTLAAMVKALCRVFLDPSNDTFATSFGFTLPTLNRLHEWTEQQTKVWLESLVVQEGENEALPRGRVQGVTQQIKAWLLDGIANMTGKQLAGAKLGNLATHIALGLSDNVGMDVKDAQVAGQAAEPVLKELREKVTACLATPSVASRAYKVMHDREMRVMVAADTNVAVDNILAYLDGDEDFRAKGYSILRLGRTETLSNELRDRYSIDYQQAKHPLYKIFKSIQDRVERQKLDLKFHSTTKKALQQAAEDMLHEADERTAVDRVREQLRMLSELLLKETTPAICNNIMAHIQASNVGEKERQLTLLRRVHGDIKRIVRYHLLLKTQVVLGTNTTLGELRTWNKRLQVSNPIMVLDEAGQATETSAMIPLTLGAEWVLMAADLKQLRPTIKSQVAQQELGFHKHGGGSIYGRLYKLGLPEEVLTVQYRMHPAIREFPSATFYGGTLHEDSSTPPDTRIPMPRNAVGVIEWWPNPGMPVAFLDIDVRRCTMPSWSCTKFALLLSQAQPKWILCVQGTDVKSNTTHSYKNAEEASAALRLALLMGTDPSVKTIALVTPYKDQEQLLKERLNCGESHLAGLRASGVVMSSINAYSIDGCQGKEADVVIVSTVRSNLGGRHLGFLADARRLNVAITRARRALIVVGDSSSLESVPEGSVDKGAGDSRNYWPRWLGWTRTNGCFVSRKDVPQRLEALAHLPHEMCVTKHDYERLHVVKSVHSNPKLARLAKRAGQPQ